MKRVDIDKRRHVLVVGTEEEAWEIGAQMFVAEARKAVASRASFSVAISGGTTPLGVYEKLAEPSVALLVNWPCVDVFWCDERCVGPDDPESNFGAAAQYFETAPLNQAKRHRLIGEDPDRANVVTNYEKQVRKACSVASFDMMLLGVGEDGHTASLFPETEALKEMTKLFVSNFVPQKQMWRLTATFAAIDQARSLYVLVTGRQKSKILKQIFFGEYNPTAIPAQRLGTEQNPACFIIDKKAAYGLGLKC